MFALIIITLLVGGVVFVNGWTDAPNAIATVVSTRAMDVKKSIIMAAVFNFIGVLFASFTMDKVKDTISGMAFWPETPATGQNPALIALMAALFAIVVWATAAWYFGIPTSESHALIAGVSGGAIALSTFDITSPSTWVPAISKTLNGDAWAKIGYGLLISSVFGVIIGYVIVKFIELLFKNAKRSTANKFFTGAQIGGGAGMAFLHGAQDGLKFIGVYVTALTLFGDVPAFAEDPIVLAVACSLIMGIGTSIGGYRIIKAVGMDMVKLEKYQGFSADLGAAIALLIATITGIPLSTTHCKTTSIMGVGAAKRMSNVNWKVAGDMVLAWVLTFPGCMLLGFLMAKVFMLIF